VVATKQFDDDEILGKAYDGRLMRRLLVFVQPYWRRLMLGIICLFVAAFVDLVPALLIRAAIDGPIAEGNIDGMWPILGMFIAALITTFLCRYGQTYFMQSVGQQVMVDIRMKIFGHIQRMSLAFFDRNPVGRLLTRLTNDVDSLNEFLSQGMVAMLGEGVRLILILITMLIINWRLALISFTVLPILVVAATFFQRAIRTAFREVRKSLAMINAYLNEQITGIVVTQLFNREDRSRIRFEDLSKDYRVAQFKSLRAYSLFFPMVGFLSVLAAALLFNLGGQVVLGGLATLGTLVAFIQYTEQAFQPIRNIAENYNTLQSAMASSERVFRILDTQQEVRDPEVPKEIPQPVDGVIAFNNVWFSYDPETRELPKDLNATAADDNWVLRGISFTIPAGQSVAVVGATGAGKTSLIGLLARFYDIQHGSITLDNIDIRDIRQHDLRRHVAAVPQDPVCFSGTIASNIRLHDETISDEQMKRAAEIANAAPFIAELPGGYDYEVRERGSNLSVGQRQLLAFSRAIAFNPEVMLILDEATSSVDTETESLIQEALERLLKGRTSIIIAHRLSTIRHVDRIIVLHKGRIVEDGSHEELLELKGFYHRLHTLQFAEQAQIS
jgi:ATP-binding cassette subfamily B multidrug efflux pump